MYLHLQRIIMRLKMFTTLVKLNYLPRIMLSSGIFTWTVEFFFGKNKLIIVKTKMVYSRWATPIPIPEVFPLNETDDSTKSINLVNLSTNRSHKSSAGYQWFKYMQEASLWLHIFGKRYDEAWRYGFKKKPNKFGGLIIISTSLMTHMALGWSL